MELRTRCQQCLSESDLPIKNSQIYPCLVISSVLTIIHNLEIFIVQGKRSFKLYPYGHDSFKQGREI